MTGSIYYINGIMTLSENVFNTLGYLPKDQFPSLNTCSTKYRRRLSLLQIIAGIALFFLGTISHRFNPPAQPQKYLSLSQQALNLGLLYTNHGLFNAFRSYLEQENFGRALTGAYDFYGRKFLPPLTESFDIQSKFFASVRRQLDRIQFVTLFPPKVLLRS